MNIDLERKSITFPEESCHSLIRTVWVFTLDARTATLHLYIYSYLALDGINPLSFNKFLSAVGKMCGTFVSTSTKLTGLTFMS